MPATPIHDSYIPSAPFRVRPEAFASLCDKAGLNRRKFATAIGAHESTVSRLLSGRIKQPSNVMVGAILAAFPDSAFDDLFEVVPAPDPK